MDEPVSPCCASESWLKCDPYDRSTGDAEEPFVIHFYLAESAFLKNGTGGYRAYEHPGSDPFPFDATICLAVWQDPSATITHYHVVFVTAQPSFFTALANSLD